MLMKHLVSVVAAGSSLALFGCSPDKAERASVDDDARISVDFKGSSAAAAPLTIPAQNGVVDRAVVTIGKISLLPAEGGDPIVLHRDPITSDLLSLATETSNLVKSTPIPAGLYRELRFVITGAYINVVGQGIFATPNYDQVPSDKSVAGTLKLPTFDPNGMKIKLPSDDLFSAAGFHKTIVARFDVAESLDREAGKGDAWVMHPVIDADSADNVAKITLEVHAGALSETISAKPWIVALYDAHGFLEMTEELEDALEKDNYKVTFPFVFPNDGPYRLAVQTVDGQPVTTEPSLPQALRLHPATHEKVHVSATAITP